MLLLTLLTPLFVITDAVMLLFIVASVLINVATLAKSVILLKLYVDETFAFPLALVTVKFPSPVIFATLLLTSKLALAPLYSFNVT